MANWIWQRKGWPNLQVDAQAYVASLSEARKQQSILLGRIQALGFEGISEATLDSWVKKALATAAIEGEKLDLASGRSLIARRLGMPAIQGPSVARNVGGLLHVTLWNGTSCSDTCHLMHDPENGPFVPDAGAIWVLP